MKAIVWTAYGDPSVLRLMEVENPTPKDDEVLIKVHATAVTTGDSKLRGFRMPIGFWLPGRLAFGLFRPRKSIIGMDFSGTVESIGKNVRQFEKGDRVCGTTGMSLGANAEYTCLSEDKVLTKIPNDLSYEESVAIIFGGLTALHFLRDKVNLGNGHKILINGASGAVGTASVQLAKYYGAEVTGVCSAANHELVRSIGVDKVIDYKKEDFTDNGETYDAILDTVGNLSMSKCKNSLNSSGKLILINTGLLTTLTSLGSKRLICGVAGENKEALKLLIELVGTGALKSVIDKIYPLKETAEAHRYVDKGHKKGNVVISVEQELKI